ncbi:unnamed protein product [Calicophoron daubneyi]|uniref:FH2 domain-containing protein n=1 Tax=Calicophoron daubneyi TaxID=300641 RepID=A0AAV2T0N5_CALDB
MTNLLAPSSRNPKPKHRFLRRCASSDTLTATKFFQMESVKELRTSQNALTDHQPYQDETDPLDKATVRSISAPKFALRTISTIQAISSEVPTNRSTITATQRKPSVPQSIPSPPPLLSSILPQPPVLPPELPAQKLMTYPQKFHRSLLNTDEDKRPNGGGISKDNEPEKGNGLVFNISESGRLNTRGRTKLLRWNKVEQSNGRDVWTEAKMHECAGDVVDYKALENLFNCPQRKPTTLSITSKNRGTVHSFSDLVTNDGMFIPSEFSADLKADSSDFSMQLSTNSRSRSSSVCSRTCTPQLLESQRCLNINIFLRQFRSLPGNPIDFIEKQQSAALGTERLKELIKLLPTEQEIKALKKFTGDIDGLDPAEKFYLGLVKIPSYGQSSVIIPAAHNNCVVMLYTSRYARKIEYMLLREEFQESVNWVCSSLEDVIGAAQALVQSKRIRGIFHVILKIGNYLNEGDRLGDAYGFKISSLLKLQEMRSGDSKLTLLHFLVQQLQLHSPDCLNVDKDVPLLKEATNTSLDTVLMEAKNLAGRFKAMRCELNQDPAASSKELRDFIQHADREFQRMNDSVRRLEEVSRQYLEYFCEDEGEFKLTESLQIFQTFFEKLRAIKQEMENADKRQRKFSAEESVIKDWSNAVRKHNLRENRSERRNDNHRKSVGSVLSTQDQGLMMQLIAGDKETGNRIYVSKNVSSSVTGCGGKRSPSLHPETFNGTCSAGITTVKNTISDGLPQCTTESQLNDISSLSARNQRSLQFKNVANSSNQHNSSTFSVPRRTRAEISENQTRDQPNHADRASDKNQKDVLGNCSNPRHHRGRSKSRQRLRSLASMSREREGVCWQETKQNADSIWTPKWVADATDEGTSSEDEKTICISHRVERPGQKIEQ